ncbi:hypothetical protein [Paraburkholderia tropica]|uniref:hypothetical protein n=1 Tax=Paraburkholderia tropica TaxID=92647 RepID=UPI002AB6E8C4|nr:hypothetical protein [Paraburkholderia tropica]
MSLTLPGLEKVKERIVEISKKTIKAGVLSGTYEDGTNIAYVAAIQEFGAPAANIPPRPFMSTTVAERQKQWKSSLARGIAAAAAGTVDANDVMDQVGGLMAADIQKKISEINSPALSPITVMLRGMRGKDASLVVTGSTVGEAAARVANGDDNYGASTKPLVDSGLLLKSISFKVD